MVSWVKIGVLISSVIIFGGLFYLSTSLHERNLREVRFCCNNLETDTTCEEFAKMNEIEAKRIQPKLSHNTKFAIIRGKLDCEFNEFQNHTEFFIDKVSR